MYKLNKTITAKLNKVAYLLSKEGGISCEHAMEPTQEKYYNYLVARCEDICSMLGSDAYDSAVKLIQEHVPLFDY